MYLFNLAEVFIDSNKINFKKNKHLVSVNFYFLEYFIMRST